MTATDTTSLVTGVDFVAQLAQDFDRAVAFYGETLGLRRSVHNPDRGFAEFETGNLTLSIIDPAKMGREHRAHDRAARRRRRSGAGDARGARRRVPRRHVRHGRLPHGVLQRLRGQRPHAPQPLRPPRHGGL